MQRKAAEATERPAQWACSAQNAQGGGSKCLAWAGPWLCFPGRSHYIRVRGTQPVLPLPPFSLGELKQLLIRKHTWTAPPPEISHCVASRLLFCQEWFSGEVAVAWELCGWTSPPPARHQLTSHRTTAFMARKGCSGISQGVEKPVYTHARAEHCKRDRRHQLSRNQTELLFPPDPFLSRPAILQWLRPKFREAS